MIGAIITRLEAQVPDLAHRVEGAAQFLALKQSGILPQSTPAAYVLPMGLRGGRASAAAGAFLQDYAEQISVILFVRNNDRTGQAALAEMRTFIFAVITALAGWQPGDEVGVFEMSRAMTLSNNQGCLIYQIDFAITDQLRIL